MPGRRVPPNAATATKDANNPAAVPLTSSLGGSGDARPIKPSKVNEKVAGNNKTANGVSVPVPTTGDARPIKPSKVTGNNRANRVSVPVPSGEGRGPGGRGRGRGRVNFSRSRTGSVWSRGGQKKSLPFSRPNMVPLKDDQDLSVLMGKLKLENTDVDSLQNGGFAPISSFEDMGLKEEILKGICAEGLTKPAGCQQKVILPCASGRDVIVQAQSGMGKTAALVISILQRLDLDKKYCQALVLAPTRELAEQLCGVFKSIGRNLKKFSYFACVGGSDMRNCKKAMTGGRHVIIGTTGRVLHMVQENFLDLKGLKTLALDEADKMLTGEFMRDVTQLLRVIPGTSQVILMSATMPSHQLKLSERFMREPIRFLVSNQELTLDGIEQFYVNVGTEDAKLSTLLDLYEVVSKGYGMIFCNLRTGVERLQKQLNDRKLNVSSIHGDKERYKVFNEFRLGTGGSRLIITSDLLGRGIDIQGVSIVINYDLPLFKEEYIHRVGRCGRYGRKGVAITLITEREVDHLKQLEEFYSTKIEQLPVNIKNLLIPGK